MDLALVDVVRWVHVIGATVLLGTGAGIAFFMVMASRTGEPRLIAHVAGTVVVADLVFTASAVVLQPITGLALASMIGWPLGEGWIVVSLGLYLVTGALWLPVVWIQLRLSAIAAEASRTDAPLPSAYQRLYAIWLACGVPAFLSVLAIVWLMTARPHFQLL